MRKIICVILCFTFVFLTSCAARLTPIYNDTETATADDDTVSTDGIHDPTGFAVGFASVDISTPLKTGLGGFGTYEERLSQTIKDPISMTCTAISDGEETLLLYGLDLLNSSKPVWDQISKMLQKDLGIPQENILMNATHSHAAPALNSSGAMYMVKYMKEFYPKAIQVAKDAVADLDRAEMYMGETHTEGLNFVRRYLKNDGTFLGGPGLAGGLDYKENYAECEPDTQMLFLRFDRKNQKDVIVANWQCHSTFVGTKYGTEVSADWAGEFRREVEKKLDAHCAFLQGAAGSLVHLGKLTNERYWQKSEYKEHGRLVAKTLIDAIPNMKKVETVKISATTELFEVTYDPAKGYSDDKTTMPLSVMAIGDVAIVTAPFEMDHRNGITVKENSPYEMTLISAYTNGSYGYIPDKEAWPNGGYEVESSRFVQGTAELIEEKMLSMLGDLHK